MGEQDVRQRSQSEELRIFLKHLLEDVRAMEHMLEEGLFETDVRRIGAEAADVLVDAAVTGIFAGDPTKLSLRAAFPKMVAMEETYGGIFKAMERNHYAPRR